MKILSHADSLNPYNMLLTLNFHQNVDFITKIHTIILIFSFSCDIGHF